MREIKTFLKIKTIVDLSELEPGDIALFNNKLYVRKYDESLDIIEMKKEESFLETIIYGIRIKIPQNVYSEEPTIERVLIKRKISTDGIITDNEFIGDETGLTFEASNYTFYNGKFSNYEPFASMTEQNIQIEEQTAESPYSSSIRFVNGKFTSLPIFFKNKEKTKTIEGIKYDYYLISPIKFDDFYPVESHVKDNGEIINTLYLESDWRQFECDERETLTTNGFHGFQLINDVLFYSYIYYIYLIKTANINPFKDIIQQNNSIFIKGPEGFEEFEGYDSSMSNSLKTITGGKTSIDFPTTVDTTKYPYYLKLSNGKDTDQFFRNIFFTDCIYNINGEYTDSKLVSFIASPRFNLTSETGCVWLLISEIVKKQITSTELNDFRTYINSNNNFTINGNDKPYIIKSVPFFYDYNDSIGVYRKDAIIQNNTYTDSGNFCIDNLRNILPVFYNAYFARPNGQNDYTKELLRKDIVENYNNVINSGSSFGVLDGISYKKSICNASRITSPYTKILKMPTYNSDRILNKEFFYERDSSDITYSEIRTLYIPQDECKKNINIIMNDKEFYFYRDMNSNDIFRNISSTNRFYIKTFSLYDSVGHGFCYFYRCTKLNDNETKFEFNWLDVSVKKLYLTYSNYKNDAYNDWNNFFVSRLVTY